MMRSRTRWVPLQVRGLLSRSSKAGGTARCRNAFAISRIKRLAYFPMESASTWCAMRFEYARCKRCLLSHPRVRVGCPIMRTHSFSNATKMMPNAPDTATSTSGCSGNTSCPGSPTPLTKVRMAGPSRSVGWLVGGVVTVGCARRSVQGERNHWQNLCKWTSTTFWTNLHKRRLPPSLREITAPDFVTRGACVAAPRHCQARL